MYHQDNSTKTEHTVDRNASAITHVENLSGMLTNGHTSEDRSADDKMKTIQQGTNNRRGAEDPYWTEGWRNPGWLAVCAQFLVYVAIFGVLMSWGTFQPVFLDDVYRGQTDSFQLAFVGTMAHALATCLGLPISLVIRRIGYKRTMAIGTVLCPLSLFLASITTQLWQLLLTRGVLYGIGSAFCFSPSFMLPSQWFVRHRALANGLGVTGGAVGTMAFSPFSQYLIATFGYRNAFQVLGGLVFGIFVLATLAARPRYQPSSTSSARGRDEKRCSEKGSSANDVDAPSASSPFLNVPFALAMVFSLLAPFGYISTFYLIPTYAIQVIGTSPAVGSALVSVASASNIVFRILLGFMGDRLGQINTLFLTTLSTGVLIVGMWQFSHSLLVYGVFCALIGATAGTYLVLTQSVVATLVGMQHLYIGGAAAWMVMSLGSLVGTPCIGKLQENLGWSVAIQFAGGACLVAALCMLVIRFLVDRRLWIKI